MGLVVAVVVVVAMVVVIVMGLLAVAVVVVVVVMVVVPLIVVVAMEIDPSSILSFSSFRGFLLLLAGWEMPRTKRKLVQERVCAPRPPAEHAPTKIPNLINTYQTWRRTNPTRRRLTTTRSYVANVGARMRTLVGNASSPGVTLLL